MQIPLVSVLVAAYNSEDFIEDALESVWDQTYPNYEIIVVNDGSTDSTASKLNQWKNKITIIEKENGGIASARNAGLAAAKGDFIAILDADDAWLPTKLFEQMEYFQSHPAVSIVFSLAQNVLHKDLVHRKNISPQPLPIIAAHIPGNCMVRKNTFDQIGYFNESIILGEFAEWYGKALNANIKIGCVDSLLLLRRIHGNNIGIKEKKRFNDYLHILKRKIDAQKEPAESSD